MEVNYLERPVMTAPARTWRRSAFTVEGRAMSVMGHVRFGSLADIRKRIRDVCFAPKSGLRAAVVTKKKRQVPWGLRNGRKPSWGAGLLFSGKTVALSGGELPVG